MSVSRCRHDVANAEALFTAQLTQARHDVSHLVQEVRGAATPMRVAAGTIVTGAILYFVRPRLGTLMRLPLLIGALTSFAERFGIRPGQPVSWDPGPPQ